ncbi:MULTISPECIES: sugar transferase [Actibacterium]|uniref:Lipopolysaccharide/colanic/teichoic acid biosynthesis glycosyltransferase n=1 Tax=Actibacterium naphthalenivorans TaxID=1614693 RepID=A0A840CFH2_9RHOB|nr:MULTISPECIES: sugar transferase [Actibacterium]ALG88946.1 sugar transferase [Actibacterium sp. EMB200-NS6]MBB4021516.1 lipopolysaccharide/colanic/teichoic acid biosynthesis glycosyltransferase [Actibacterium naphthalenivorans]
MTVNFPKNSEDAEALTKSMAVIAASESQSFYRNFGKRILDSALILATAPFVAPLILIFALLVALDGGRPFFRQRRVGLNGKTFEMWKLRTMVPDAEAQLERHLASDPEARCEWEVSQKLKSDPRVTRVGRLLRKTSMDELPQFLNVLKGEMAIVGPRPMLSSQQDLYPGSAYYKLRPGITGPWQVSNRNDSEFKSRAIYDTRYDQEVSLKTDLSIMFKTVSVVFRGTGY